MNNGIFLGSKLLENVLLEELLENVFLEKCYISIISDTRKIQFLKKAVIISSITYS